MGNKIGISISIDVTKVEKARLHAGTNGKGKYLDLTTFIDLDEVDQYKNNGFISQQTSKEEREQGVRTPILGNCKVFFNNNQSPAPHAGHQPSHQVQTPQAAVDDWDGF